MREVWKHSVWAMSSVLLLRCGHLAVALQFRLSEPLDSPAAGAPAVLRFPFQLGCRRDSPC